VFIAMILLAATGAAPPETDTLAQIQAGKILCVNPDAATKTCSTITSYTLRETKTFLETGEVLISPDQPVTFKMSMLVDVRGASICGTPLITDFQKGTVSVDGAPLPPDRNEAAITKLVETLKPMAGRQVCEAIQLDGGKLMKYGQVERVDLKLPGKPVGWISPREGYRVAPR
jgi:hypothetical protein